MKPTRPIFSLILVAAACGGGTPRRAADAPPAAVATARAEVVDVPSTFEAGGIVRAHTTASIASRVLAPVVTVHVRAGDHVRRGAPLVTLEGRQMAAARIRAQAAAGGTEDNVRAAQASVAAAEAALALARATYERVRVLRDKRSATPHELDQATAARDGAAATFDSARASLDAAAATEAYTTLTAPFDGVITERAVDPGDMATPGVRLLTLEDVRALRLEVTVDEARAANVSRAQTVRVWLSSPTPAAWVDAIVGEIARVDPASHSFLVKLDLPATVTASSGTFGRAQFSGPSHTALVIPAAAAVQRGQLTFVYAVDDDHRVHLQPISAGAQTGDRLEVLAGLSEHARVVSQPPASLADGVHINEGTR